nr:immunoglobulin light chain junction region [Macaca mulatta]
CQQISNPPLTF